MKLNFLKYKTRSWLRKNKALRANVPYKKALTTGIIFTVEDKQKHHAVKEFIKQLEQDGKNVHVMEFLPERRDNYEFKFDFFTEKDINFWGHLNSTTANQFAESSLDYLFYLDMEPNPYILHLLAKSKAKCRVGKFWDEGANYLDFMVKDVATYQALLDTTYKYITQLR